ncbi:MAG: carboxypeptidase regulatory-like domain-containing protein [Blastocatellia bacterium]|nr:carboxypeptidase regulatory-like domain-containing protein [Blastocatellia bacterium]
MHKRISYLAAVFLLMIPGAGLAQSGGSGVMAKRGWQLMVPRQTRPGDGVVAITGTIEDPEGAVIPKAKVTLTPKPAGEARQAMADEAGNFRFASVAPGTYELAAEAKGFEAKSLSVTVANAPLDGVKLKLKVAAKGEAVTVASSSGSAEEETISLERNASRLNFEDDLLRNLPAEGQNIVQVVSSFLSPAGGQTSVVVDGVEVSALDLPARALRRVRLNRNPYSVEYRRPGKSRIEAYTDEGSFRRYHGSVAYFARNSFFDARNAFALTRPDLDRRLLELALSGPFPGKRAAFFVTGERLINNETSVVNALTLNGASVANVPNPGRRTNLLGRVDLRAGKEQNIAMLYSFRDESERARGIGGLRLAEQGYDTAERRNRFQISNRGILRGTLLNDLRLTIDRSTARVGRPAGGPAIVVIGAFTGGSTQRFEELQTTSLRIQDVMTYARGIHSLRFGTEIRPIWIDAVDASNFGGTFEFSSLAQFAAGTPFVYRVNRGTPAISVTQTEAYGFIQDEMKLRPDFQLTLGVRYGWQANLRDRNNFAPRMAFAYAPGDRKLILRGGLGVFYERIAAEVTQRVRLNNGSRIRETVVSNPGFPAPTGPSTTPPPSVLRADEGLRAPYLGQASISIERELWKRAHLTVEYQTLRGVHLLRSRNINAPLPASLAGRGARVDPFFLNINQVESSAASRSHSVNVTYRGGIGRRFKGMAQYTWSRSWDDATGTFSLPADNFNLRPEWGRSDFDQRHRFSLVGTLDLPWNTRIGTFVTLASGIPFDITTGRDNNGDTLANDRPAGISRNTGSGPNLARVDLRFTKHFRVPRLLDRKRDSTSRNLEFSIDFLNLFNRVNLNNYIGAQSSPFFGRAISAQQARAIQLSTRYRF